MLIVRFLCWKNMSCVSTKHIGRFMVSQTPILNLPHNGVREIGLSVPSLVSPPRFVPASKWGRRINKQCTSDYWAEDQSEHSDRSLLPSLPSSPSPLHPHILPVLLPVSPSPLLSTHRSLSSSQRCASLFVLSPLFSLPLLLPRPWSIKVCRMLETLGKHWSEKERGRARSPGLIQKTPQNVCKRPWHTVLVFLHCLSK